MALSAICCEAQIAETRELDFLFNNPTPSENRRVFFFEKALEFCKNLFRIIYDYGLPDVLVVHFYQDSFAL